MLLAITRRPAIASSNAYAALAEDEDEDETKVSLACVVDAQNMSLEELKQRAAAKNRELEEQKRKDLEARDRALTENTKVVRSPVITQSMRETKAEEAFDLEINWEVDLRGVCARGMRSSRDVRQRHAGESSREPRDRADRHDEENV